MGHANALELLAIPAGLEPATPCLEDRWKRGNVMKPLDTGFTALQQVAELANSRCKTSPPPRQARKKPPVFSGNIEMRERAVELARTGTMTVQQISERVGLGVNWLREVLRDAGVAAPRRARATYDRGIWPADVDDQLRALAAQGLTAFEIGWKLGRTRNAVLGRAHRLKIQVGKPRGAKAKAPRQRSERGKRETRPAIFTRRQMVPGVWTYSTKLGSSLTPEPLPVEEEWKGPVVALADLERTQCHFPVGDPAAPGFGYCGCPDTVERGEGRTRYCRPHYRKMYQPRTR